MGVYNYLKAILACVILQLESEGRGAGCAQLVLPGEAVFRIGLDEDSETGEGQVWVRLASAIDSVDVGQPNTDPLNCVSLLGMTIEVGVVRCFPHPDDAMELDPDQVEGAALLQLQDMESIRYALRCCEVLKKGDWILGAYTPVGPRGPDVGGYWTLTAVPLDLPVA